MRAKVRGVEIYFDVDGVGLSPQGGRMVERPALFVLHGGPGGDHSSFKSQVTANLTEVAQLVYVDHRGAGRSGACDLATNTLDNNIDDVEALREHLGLEDIAILGSSYGGMVAQGYAIRYPNRISSLILVATAPSYRFIEEARAYVESHGDDDQRRVCQWLWDGNFHSDEQIHEFYQHMGPMYSTSFDAEQFAKGWDRGIRNYEQLNLGFSTFLREFDFTEDLRQIRCPTLVLAGAHDWICSANQSREIARRIPRAHLKVFAESGHSIANDEPEAYFNAVRGFLTYAGPPEPDDSPRV